MSITYEDVRNMDVNRFMCDFYVLERLVADGSRSARIAQRKLEAYAAPRLMRYLSDVCGGEVRHIGGGEGCEGWECAQDETLHGICACCDEDEDAHSTDCTVCGEPNWLGCDQAPCDCSDEDCDGECNYHEYDDPDTCGCYCPQEGLCYACEQAQSFDVTDLPGKLGEWLRYQDRGSRSGCWRSWHDFHDEHGSVVMQWLWSAFADVDWPSGYGGDMWASVAKYAYLYGSGQLSAHAFMDRVWTLQHNGGSVFDKMYEEYTLMRLLEHQSHDNYRPLLKYASEETKGLWAIRPYVLSDSLDRDPAWLGTTVPQEVEW